VVPKAYAFFHTTVKNNEIVEGNAENHNLGCFNIKSQVKCFMAIPLNDGESKKVKGLLYLGFTSKKQLSSQELDFYDMFVKSASQALAKSGLLK
jgi:LytS/YehU family sensor histidine kinase